MPDLLAELVVLACVARFEVVDKLAMTDVVNLFWFRMAWLREGYVDEGLGKR